MFHRIVLSIWMTGCAFLLNVNAQTLFVDPVRGKAGAPGSRALPLGSLEEAVALANRYRGSEPIKIELAPGLYVLSKQVLIDSIPGGRGVAPYIIESLVMPDDSDWQPEKMPVIQSVSGNNKNYGSFDHCIGIQVERSHVQIRGLKFTGNPNPTVGYYYPIERHRPDLSDLEISQCYFIGDRNAASIQGAVFAQGPDIHIDHSIFYGCKNAVLVFVGIGHFSLTHSIIYGAYEGAFWFGYGESADLPFTFSDNIVANGNYFFVGDKGVHPGYAFQHSLISGNAHYMGFNGDTIRVDLQNKPRESGMRKSGRVLLNEITAKGVPRDHLNLAAGSAGRDIDAGIFKRPNIESKTSGMLIGPGPSFTRFAI